MLYRIEGGRVIRRIAVGGHARASSRVGGSRSGWARSAAGPAGDELVRVDPDDGKVVAAGRASAPDVPQTLVPVGKDLWVITSGGEAMLVSPG